MRGCERASTLPDLGSTFTPSLRALPKLRSPTCGRLFLSLLSYFLALHCEAASLLVSDPFGGDAFTRPPSAQRYAIVNGLHIWEVGPAGPLKAQTPPPLLLNPSVSMHELGFCQTHKHTQTSYLSWYFSAPLIERTLAVITVMSGIRRRSVVRYFPLEGIMTNDIVLFFTLVRYSLFLGLFAQV